jgi:hypothetical protein
MPLATASSGSSIGSSNVVGSRRATTSLPPITLLLSSLHPSGYGWLPLMSPRPSVAVRPACTGFEIERLFCILIDHCVGRGWPGHFPGQIVERAIITVPRYHVHQIDQSNILSPGEIWKVLCHWVIDREFGFLREQENASGCKLFCNRSQCEPRFGIDHPVCLL